MNFLLPPDIVSDLTPFIITSPTIRSGTTLLQRLLCSSRNALIYGEECGKDLDLILQIFASKVATYSHSRDLFSSRLQLVLEGNVNHWMLDLMPDIDGYLKALGQGYLSGLAYCRDYALEVGRPVWGIKYPSLPPHLLNLIRQVIPQARFIIIYRDLVESLRSAKARGSVNFEPEVRQFCNEWRINLAFMLNMSNDPAVLLVKYAELVTQPEIATEKIAEFTGLRDLQLEILNHKINNWGDSTLTTQPGYIEPAQLTEAETSIALEAASWLSL